MKKIQVLIVEDSPVIQEFLQYIINRDSRLEVAAVAGSAEQALRLINRISPDVISMDIRLPGMDGFEATQRIMSVKPTPIVVVSANIESRERNISMNALRAGALSIVEKPVGLTHDDYEALAERLCTQLAIMSQVKVVRQRRRPVLAADEKLHYEAELAPKLPPARQAGTYRILGVVTSTGGPNALVKLFEGLTGQFPLPVLLVQHITPAFLGGFVSWLDSVSPLSVVIANDRELPRAGKVYVAPPDHHLRIEGGRLRISKAERVSAQRPSGTVLLQAMADDFGSRGIGVVLTGMGDDGAQGLLALRESGGFTIAEDESTATVYGMPAVAKRIGAACETLPLHQIAPRILDIVCETCEVVE